MAHSDVYFERFLAAMGEMVGERNQQEVGQETIAVIQARDDGILVVRSIWILYLFRRDG